MPESKTSEKHFIPQIETKVDAFRDVYIYIYIALYYFSLAK